jgi:hypothetical protein
MTHIKFTPSEKIRILKSPKRFLIVKRKAYNGIAYNNLTFTDHLENHLKYRDSLSEAIVLEISKLKEDM